VGQDVYQRLLEANPFVTRLYPNFHRATVNALQFNRGRLFERARAVVEALLAIPSVPLEGICRSAYRAHLARKSSSWQSPDQVRLQPDCLKLHTQSHRRSVLDRFDRAVHDTLD